MAAQEGLKGADASLLTSRESARLLSQELGLTLPRAITSGMSRIPDLQSALLGLGAVAVGIFAVKEAGKFLGSMADAIRESVVATGAFEDLGKAAEAAFKGAREEAVKAYTDFKSIAAGAFRIDEIHAQTEVLTKYVQAFAMLKDKAAGDLRLLGIINIEALRTINDAAHHGITSLKEAEQKLAEASQLEFNARKRFGEVKDKQAKDDEKAAEKAARQANARAKVEEKAHEHILSLYHQNLAAVTALHEGLDKLVAEGLPRMDKQLAHMVVHTTEWFKADTKLTEAERGRLPLLHDETTALAHLRAEAEANVRTMMLGEIPALRRIDLQYEHQMLTAGRALAVERKRRAEGEATLAELESAEADYTAATEAYAGARTMARKLETLAFKEAVASEISGFLQRDGFAAGGGRRGSCLAERRSLCSLRQAPLPRRCPAPDIGRDIHRVRCQGRRRRWRVGRQRAVTAAGVMAAAVREARNAATWSREARRQPEDRAGQT